MSIKSSPLDWLSFPPSSPGDVHAPHPDLFELELDSSIIALPQGDQEQLQLLNIDISDPYAFVRSDTPRCGPPSTFTVSSESTYDSYSSHSESLYNLSNSPSDFDDNGDYRVDLGIDFSKFSVDVDAAAAEAKVQLTASGNVKDEPDNALGLLPKMDNKPALDAFGVHYGSPNTSRRTSFQEGMAPSPAAPSGTMGGTIASSVGYYASAMYQNKPAAVAQSTISPTNLLSPSGLAMAQNINHSSASPTPSPVTSNNSVGSAPMSMTPQQMAEHRDPRKKYKCSSCPRGTSNAFFPSILSILKSCSAFARAYNLKTHLQTHDPNRLKPHTCPHRACGRSFSRKHDLGRHLVSIHRDEPVGNAGDQEHKSIGVTQGVRKWCDHCGVGWVGKQSTCACQEVK